MKLLGFVYFIFIEDELAASEGADLTEVEMESDMSEDLPSEPDSVMNFHLGL